MPLLVASALYVVGGIMFLVSLASLGGALPRESAFFLPSAIGGGFLIGMGAIIESLQKIAAKLK